MDLTQDASKNITDRLTWHTANRDQSGIAQDLANGKDIPEVYGLGEAGLFDEFFWHIDPVVLHSQSLMRLVGFNGRQIKEGTCDRGKSLQILDGSARQTGK